MMEIIVLSDEMKSALMAAERSLQDGTCLSESDFKRRFSRWL